MAKIKRNIQPATRRDEQAISRRSLIAGKIRKIIPFWKPVRPKPTIPEIDPDAGNTGENNTTSTTGTSTTTGSTGGTDPGTSTHTSTTSSDMEPLIGEIKIFAGPFAPRGWAFCDGQILAISDYTALFSLLGSTYGGDGKTSFALPDLRGRVPVHAGQGVGLSNYQAGMKGGSESVMLTVNDIPAHNHFVNHATNTADANTPSNKLMAPGGETIYSEGDHHSQMNQQMIDNTGGGQAHSNIQPFIAINFIIALEGIYPSRS